MTPRAASAARIALVFVAYLLLAVLFTWPLAPNSTQHVVGHVPRESTPPLNIWAMATVIRHLPWQPLQIFEGNAFYPYRHTVAFSEHLFVPALLAWPWFRLTGNWPLAYNLVELITLAIGGLGMYLFCRYLTGHGLVSFAAGGLYAFHTWNINELVRIQIVSNQYFPFVLLGLVAYFTRPSPGRAALTGLAASAQSLSCMYWALYLPGLVAVVTGYLQWRHRLPWRRLLPLLGAFVITAGLTVSFLVPYVLTSRELGLRRTVPTPLRLDRYLDVLPQNVLYAGALGTARFDQNAAHFLGFAAMALGVVGLFTRRIGEPARSLRPLLAALAAGGFVLSLGPQVQWGERIIAPAPYALLYRFVPGFQHVRYPERFCVILMLGLAPLVAFGLSAAAPLLRRAGTAGVGAFLLLEHLSIPQWLSPLPAGQAVPEVYRWLARQPDARVVAVVPADRFLMERMDALPMYLSTIHGKRAVQGYSGYFPPAYHFVRWRLFHFPEPESVDFLARLGVDTIVVEPEVAASFGPDPRWEVRGPFVGGHVVLRLRQTTEPIALTPPSGHERLRELSRDGWQVRASAVRPRAAIDGNPATAWETSDRQQEGDFYVVRFPSPALICRVSVAPSGASGFPMRLQLLVQRPEGGWVELPFARQEAYDGLFAALLQEPARARLDIDFAPVRATAIRLRITETDEFSMPWTLPELRVYGPR